MQFRCARHTKDLGPMLEFYTQVIGLELLGNFENHDAYDGIFLGFPNQDWEIEFTVSDETPGHTTDEDDLLVFYFNSEAEINAVVKRAVNAGIHPVKAKNPYWNANGMTLPDPDGFLVTLALKSPKLTSGELTKIATGQGIDNWNSLLRHVQDLPYGRNVSRSDFGLVLSEAKGSCSSKHALLKSVADENGIPAKLMLGIYRMHKGNTGIGSVLDHSGLDYVPEAHCYLKFGNNRFDFTNPHSDISRIESEILEEIEIEPHQVIDFKVGFHRDFIKKWRISEKITVDFETVWNLREKCISELARTC